MMAYDRGHGKSNKQLGPSAGLEKGSTYHGPNAVARDGVQGKAGPKRGYDTSAHTESHHGKSGEARGHVDDLVHNFGSPGLYSEGRELSDMNPGWVSDGGHGQDHRAEHHPKPPGPAHTFQPTPSNAHGYGYKSEHKVGHLRMSGHSGGHRIGKR